MSGNPYEKIYQREAIMDACSEKTRGKFSVFGFVVQIFGM